MDRWAVWTPRVTNSVFRKTLRQPLPQDGFPFHHVNGAYLFFVPPPPPGLIPYCTEKTFVWIPFAPRAFSASFQRRFLRVSPSHECVPHRKQWGFPYPRNGVGSGLSRAMLERSFLGQQFSKQISVPGMTLEQECDIFSIYHFISTTRLLEEQDATKGRTHTHTHTHTYVYIRAKNIPYIIRKYISGKNNLASEWLSSARNNCKRI
jgi:hypothetical protein